MYYDAVNFVYRAFVDTTEVWIYLNQAKYRTGMFPVLVNTGGVLSSGVITGGTNRLWFYKNGTNRNNLVEMDNILSVNGQVGAVITKNADSIRGYSVDTTVAGSKNGYLLYIDTIAHKIKLVAPGGTGTVTNVTATSPILITASRNI